MRASPSRGRSRIQVSNNAQRFLISTIKRTLPTLAGCRSPSQVRSPVYELGLSGQHGAASGGAVLRPPDYCGQGRQE